MKAGEQEKTFTGNIFFAFVSMKQAMMQKAWNLLGLKVFHENVDSVCSKVRGFWSANSNICFATIV